MTHILTFFELMEIRELLFLKTSSLKKSESFLNTVEDRHHTGSLEADIALSIQEITDLEYLLVHSTV